MTSVDVRHGDCLAVLRDLPDNSVDSVVTDPPYGLSNTKPSQVADVLAAWVTGDTEAVPSARGGFMGKDWDSFVPPPAVWAECARVLKPGGHMVVFAGARTQDLMGLSIRLAGFEIREGMGWIFGSGFPKSHDIGKAIDKAAGVRPPHGKRFSVAAGQDERGADDGHKGNPDTRPLVTDAAKQWDGWGTALKPAIEPIILARKPLVGTVAQNVLEHGVGGLNIDACRVGMSDTDREVVDSRSGAAADYDGEGWGKRGNYPEGRKFKSAPAGRFPANVLLDEHAAKEMDRQSGVGVSRKGKPRRSKSPGEGYGMTHTGAEYNDQGGASRFFPVFKYQAKAPKKERPVIERPPMLQLRDDLTPEQVDHVRARLAEAGVRVD